MTTRRDSAGLAALSICESLLILLVEKGVLGAEEARGALEDAVAARMERERFDHAPDLHEGAAKEIERLVTQIGAARNGASEG